jgi:hypothetical protein
MVFVIALNPKRRIMFVWKCQAVSEARGIVRRLATIFGDSLSNITLSHRSRDSLLFKQHEYDTIKNFTYEQNKYWYVGR